MPPLPHRLLLLALLGAPLLALANPAGPAVREEAPAFVSGAGILPARVHAILLNADTELSGYPAAFVGWRMGLADQLDLGLEVGGNDVAVLGRLHAKVRLFEPAGRRWFGGGRLRVEFKRHRQDFGGDLFRPIDDLGFTFVPELSLGLRLGTSRSHALYYAVFYYLDVDVRQGRELDHYLMPGLIGYEGRLWRGLHLGVEAGVFFEVGRPETAGEPIIKAGLTLAYELR